MWLRQAHGIGHPVTAPQLLDYLVDRRGEPCTRGTLSAIFAAMRFADEAMGIPMNSRLTEDPVIVGLAKGIIAQAPASVGPRAQGPANAPLVSVLMRLEEIVDTEARAPPDRMAAWWMLVSAWTCCRFDDHRGLSPRDIVLAEGNVDLTFSRSKTTGDDKPVRYRRAAISKEAWLLVPGWLETGLALWREAAPRDRDFFLVQWGPTGAPCYREQGYVEYAGRMRGLLSSFVAEDGQELGPGWASYLRPHSWRSFLPSMTVALGAPADTMKWVSAWRAQASDLYVRTSRTRTMITQNTVARLLKLHLGEDDPVGESHALNGLRKHMMDRGSDEEEVERVVRALRVFGDQPVKRALWDVVSETTSEVGKSSDRPTGKADLGVIDDDLKTDTEISDDDAKSSPLEGYVVATSRRRGTRCLHKVGLCYRRPGVHYATYRTYGGEMPPTSAYDVVCRDCWRQTPRQRGTTASGWGSDTGSSRRTSSTSSTSSEESDR